MLSDIAHGHVDGADVCFLIAVIVFVVAALLALTGKTIDKLGAGLIPIGLAVGFLGWLIL